MDSIKTHHLVGPLIWNERTGNLIGGHQRLSKIDILEKTKNGDYLIEVTKVDLDDEKEKSLNVVLNNASAQGEWDLDLLRGVIEDLAASDVPFESTGFTSTDLSLLLGDEFLSGALAQQNEIDTAIVAEFDAIKAVSAEYDPTYREDAKQYRGTPEIEEDYEEIDSEIGDDTQDDRQSFGDGSDSIDEPGHQADAAKPKINLRPEIDPETGEKIWTQGQRSEFDRKRDEAKERTQYQYDADVLITMSFQSRAQLLRFIDLVGADVDSRSWDKGVVESIFKIDLGETE